MEREILALESFLPYRLNRLADAVSREFSRIYRDRYGLTRPEWRLLATLGQYGTMTATAVGAHSAMHKTKVSRAVAALEKRRWLTRSADEGDRRVEHLALTKAGETAYREMVPLAKAFEAAILARMSKVQRKAVLTGLDALEESLRCNELFAERKSCADFDL
jgi:DNA-binding MarR family transcriptional regulator